ncbi:MAG: hypothetical protein UEP57_03830 [Oscillospiraceae bacterium]|nr:hypothetical protein [Oscillospiraceae bacterium]
MRKAYEVRNKLYAYNVVFGKYRDLVALSTFYEYLLSGRCSSLEGTNGAYNLYETEIRANIIISKLDRIIDSLEAIQNNQYMLYAKITEMNRSLHDLEESAFLATENIKKMGDDLEQLAQDSSVIAYNTKSVAYYAKRNAELTNALGFMVAFK